MSLQRTSRLLLLAGLALSLETPSNAMADAVQDLDYRALYRQATEALERGEPGRAVDLLEQAIAKEPREKVGLIRRYLPQYYLGIAYSELGRCREALATWQESEDQRVITRRREYADLRSRQLVCRKSLAIAKTEAAVSEAEGLADHVLRLSRTHELSPSWKRGDPSMAARQAVALKILERARRAFQQAQEGGELAEIEGAKTSADNAVAALARLRADADLEREQVEVRRQAAVAEPPTDLLAGAGAFFDADYSKALETLADVTSEDPRVRAHVALFRAAASYAVFLLGGETDQSMLRTAQLESQRCREIDSSLRPTRNAFSPRFIEFFSSRIGQPEVPES